jgi:AmmeMemoRadiSam system protein B
MLDGYQSIEPVRIRDPIVSGIFYPEEPVELKNSVDAYLKKVGRIRMDALAVVSPHAGIAYSGSVQAKALAAARSRRIENVVILSPRHKSGDSLIFLPESDFFSTPFGKIRVARELLAEIESCGTVFTVDDIPHMEEHAIEVQLPFIARLFPDAAIVPLILGSSERVIARSASRALELVFSDRLETTLFVVSSNLSRGPEAQEAQKSSIAFIKDAERGDGESILISAGITGAACGAQCLAALSSCAFMRGRKMETLCLDNSASAKGKEGSNSAQGEPPSLGEDIVVYAALAYY